MKILFFSRDYTNHDYRWLQALSDAGYQVLFLRLERDGSNLDQRPFPEAVREVDWTGGKQPFDWQQADQLQGELAQIIEREQPDVLHAGPLNTASVLAARTSFHPLVQMSWGSDILRFAQENGQQRLLVQESLNSADALIGDCDAVRQAAIAMGLPAEAIVAFPWGIDIDRFSPAKGKLCQELGWQDNFVLLHTRALEKEYGADSVAEAFLQAAQADESIRVIFAGDGSLKVEIEESFSAASLSANVLFAGQLSQDQQPDIFRSADLYVSGTFSDGSSVSLMEAQASRLPVLVSNIPGNREWVSEGQQGWLFPAGNVEPLTEKIRTIRALPADQLTQIGKQARKQAEFKADWRKNQLLIPQAYEIAMQRAKDSATL